MGTHFSCTEEIRVRLSSCPLMNKQEKRERNRKYQNKWYHRNKGKRKNAVRARQLMLRKWLDDYKATQSCACGEDDPICLDFHHLRDKSIEISNMPSLGYSIARIKKEIDKCIVLCANCHRKLHAKNMQE